MSTQIITLNLPEALYERLKHSAEQSHRSVEAELLALVSVSVPMENELLADLRETLDGMTLLDDKALWRAARRRLPLKISRQLETLNLKSQREGLTESETQTRSLLLRQYDKTMLVRAKAAVLLKERGHDISELGPKV